MSVLSHVLSGCTVLLFMLLVGSLQGGLPVQLSAHIEYPHIEKCPFRHNEMKDIISSLTSEVCHSVCIEPLQPLSGERMSHSTANTDINARLDVSAYGLWGGRFNGRKSSSGAR